jgi:predicted site-specific integrase-resolvase
MKAMNVSEAARRLEIHQNTLRRWVKAGFVRSIDLPSGVSRFDPAEVERVRTEMYKQMADASSADIGDLNPGLRT